MIFNQYCTPPMYSMCSAGCICLLALFFFIERKVASTEIFSSYFEPGKRDYYRKCFGEKQSESRLFDIYMA